MTESEYQSQIPIFCRLQTAQDHVDRLMLCWSISYGLMRDRGIEGPQNCHTCDISIRAKRWDRIWYKRFKNGTLPEF